MPINTDLNISPYFDDYDIENQYYKVLFKPAYAVQARELTQLQTILQNQIEQFGDNIFKEGSIVKGSTFTNLKDLKFVKLANKTGFSPESFVPTTAIEEINGVETEVDITYQIVGQVNGLIANIVAGRIGYESRPPNLNTFWINYLNTNESVAIAKYKKAFLEGETLNIYRYKFIGGEPHPTAPGPTLAGTCSVTTQVDATGNAFGIQSSPGIIFQKGHFLYTSDQTLVVSEYSNLPDGVSVGYKIEEELVDALADNDLYDNALGSRNYNAPGADRLKLTPILTVLDTADADVDKDFFTLIRYQNGSAVLLRDVSQYNVLGEEMAKRTYEESGNYIVNNFNVVPDRRDGNINMIVNPGIAYVKGHRVENRGQRNFVVDSITDTAEFEQQPISQHYGSYVDIVAFSGAEPLLEFEQYDVQNAGNADIGLVMTYNITPDRLYITNPFMAGTPFSDAKYLQVGSGTDYIEFAEGSTLKDVKNAPLIFDTGTFSLAATRNITIVKRERELLGAPGGVITKTITDPNDSFREVSNDDVLVLLSTDGSKQTVTNVTSTETTLTITLASTPPNSCYVYYNKRTVATPKSKTKVEPYIKLNYTSSTEKYSLGFPDVYKIVSIVDTSGKDWTSSFRLVPNQKDTMYAISYMEYIPGRPQPSSPDTLTLKLNVFQIDTNDDYFFTVNSYNVVNGTPGAGEINANEIPVYVGQNNKRYNLRECFDFRPYATKDAAADYNALTAGSAPIISAVVDGTVGLDITSGYGDFISLSPINHILADLEYYTARIDLITIDSYGKYTYVKGTEEERPRPPKVDPGQLVISQITVPGLPALTPKEAAQQRKNQYAIDVKSKGIKNYTMKDIQTIENKVKALEYQVQLNQLEQEVQNLNILDENGLTRFKNGWIVDSFKNLQLGDLDHPNFSASVPFDVEHLAPAVRTFPMDLKVKSSTNATIFPDTLSEEIGSLNRNAHISLIAQNYATTYRNAVSNFYKYSGEGTLSPDHDMVHDTVGDPMAMSIDFSAPFNNFLENLQEFIPLTGSRTRTFTRQIGNAAQWFPTTVTETRTSTLALSDDESFEDSFSGDMVSNFEFKPYLRSRDVAVYMSGLRPNTRHYFFFDGVAVNDHVCPGSEADYAREIRRAGQLGDSVTTDSNGVLRAIFRIPAESFFVGDRKLEVVDVDQIASIASASTSYGSLVYHGYNINVERSALTGTVRVPMFDINTTTTERNGPRRARPQESDGDVGDRGGGNNDPLAQTFFIKEGMGQGSNSVFVSKIDLYFKKKSTTNGVNVMLREVINGYPSPVILPFSHIHLRPDQVNISSDASVVTTVDFDAPVRLDVEKEYCVVIKPDANDPNYLVYTSKVGENDITPDNLGVPVVQDWGDGVLFTSTNNRAWKSYQDEDIKFELYRHNFNAATGSIKLTPYDMEFLTIEDPDGSFNPGEVVFQEKALDVTTSPTVSGNIGNTTISGTGLDATYSIGSSVIIRDSGDNFRDVFTIASVDSATAVTLNKPLHFAVSSGTMKPIVSGDINYYNPLSPEKLYLRNSNADTSIVFEGSDTQSNSSLVIVEGLDSRNVASVVSVDDINISYIQPMIMKSDDSVTSTTLSGTFVDPTDPLNTYDMSMKFADNNYFNNKGNLLYSKSNDPNQLKPFDITVNMSNASNSTSSPIVDLETATLIAYQYKTANTAADAAKYISKTIELKDDLDAEDFNLILTGYRPKGTEIKVYIKAQNAYDYATFHNLDWIEMEISEGVGLFSSSSNNKDFKEFTYVVPAANKSGGVLTYTSTDGTSYTGFKRFAVKIELLADVIYRVPYVEDYRGIALT